jgi:hypothetical protein
MTKLLSAERKLGGMGQIPLIGKVLVATANAGLRLGEVRRKRRSDSEITQQEGPCGEEFSELALQVSPACGVCVSRTAAYLNWRFLSHFHHKYELLTARQKGVLRGYLLFLQEEKTATIVDLFGAADQDMRAELVTGALQILRKRGVFNVNAPCLSSQAQAGFFRRLGFFPRETHPVMICGAQSAASQGVNLDGQEVFLMDGDRDS